MSIGFGPVPTWSAPLSEKLVFVAFIVGVIFLADGIRRQSQSESRSAIVFAVIALALKGFMVAFR